MIAYRRGRIHWLRFHGAWRLYPCIPVGRLYMLCLHFGEELEGRVYILTFLRMGTKSMVIGNRLLNLNIHPAIPMFQVKLSGAWATWETGLRFTSFPPPPAPESLNWNWPEAGYRIVFSLLRPSQAPTLSATASMRSCYSCYRSYIQRLLSGEPQSSAPDPGRSGHLEPTYAWRRIWHELPHTSILRGKRVIWYCHRLRNCKVKGLLDLRGTYNPLSFK